MIHRVGRANPSQEFLLSVFIIPLLFSRRLKTMEKIEINLTNWAPMFPLMSGEILSDGVTRRESLGASMTDGKPSVNLVMMAR